MSQVNTNGTSSCVSDIANLSPPERAGHVLRENWIVPASFDVLFGAHVAKNRVTGEDDAGLRHPADIIPFLFDLNESIVGDDDLAAFYFHFIPNAQRSDTDLIAVGKALRDCNASREEITAVLRHQYTCSPYDLLRMVVKMARAPTDERALWEVPQYMIDWIRDTLMKTRTPYAPFVDRTYKAELEGALLSERVCHSMMLVRAIQVLTPLARNHARQLSVHLMSAAHAPFLAAHSNPDPDPDLEQCAKRALFKAYVELKPGRESSGLRYTEHLMFALLTHLIYYDAPDSPWRYDNCPLLRDAVWRQHNFPAMIALSGASSVVHGFLAIPFYSVSFLDRWIAYFEMLMRNENSANLVFAPGVLDAVTMGSGAQALYDRALAIYDCSLEQLGFKPAGPWSHLSVSCYLAFAKRCYETLGLQELLYYTTRAPTDDEIMQFVKPPPSGEEATPSSSNSTAVSDDETPNSEDETAKWFYAVRPKVVLGTTTVEEYNAYYEGPPPEMHAFAAAINEIEEGRARPQRRRKRRRR